MYFMILSYFHFSRNFVQLKFILLNIIGVFSLILYVALFYYVKWSKSFTNSWYCSFYSSRLVCILMLTEMKLFYENFTYFLSDWSSFLFENQKKIKKNFETIKSTLCLKRVILNLIGNNQYLKYQYFNKWTLKSFDKTTLRYEI